MKILLYCCSILFASVLFTACQKEIDWSIPAQPSLPNKVDSIMLSKFFLLDTTFPASLDTLTKVVLEYDSQDRVVKMNRSFKNPTLPPSSGYHFYDSITYYYNGNDSLPYKLTKATRNFTSLGRDTAFFFYAGGKVIRDSIRNTYERVIYPFGPPFETIKVNVFTDNGNTTTMFTQSVTSFSPSSWPPPCPTTTVFQKTLDANGNITRQVGAVTNCGGSGSVTSHYLSFDNMPNPGFDFSIPYPIRDLDLQLSEQKNNIIQGWSANPSDGFQSTYTYRADGYPLITRTFDLVNPTRIQKGLYFYR